jgi:Secretion system C-terminal sorting domain
MNIIYRLLFYQIIKKNIMKKIIQSFLLFTVITTTSYAQTYVATTGNDVTGNGTVALPYKTIIKGVQATAIAGTVLVASGTYNEASEIFIDKALTLKRNGTAAVIVNASGRGTGPFKYMLGIVNTSNVTVDGLSFVNNIGNAGKAIWILGAGNNITVKNCLVANIGWISNNLNAKPANSSIACNAIRVEGNNATALTNITLLNNNVENCATGWGEAVTITGNVNGFLVQGNFIFNIANIGIDAAGNYFTGAPANVNQARNGVIISNEIYNCMSRVANSAGIYLDGSVNCRVEKNEVYQCGVGISVGGEQPLGAGATALGGHVINNNEIYNNVIAGAVIGTNLASNSITNTKVFNNTFYKNRTAAIINGVDSVDIQPIAKAADSAGGEVQLQNSNGVTFKNNILYATSGKKALVALFSYTVANFVSNYNLYHRDVDLAAIISIGGGGAVFNGSNVFGSYTPAQFATVRFQDINSTTGNPLFVNANIFDFYLQSTSPARNKGDIIYDNNAAGVTDFSFSTRRREGRVDIGCLEFQTGTSGFAAPATAAVSDENYAIPSFSIFPNPAKDFVNISFGKNVKNAVVTIMDLNGRVLLNKNVKNGYMDRINIASLKTASQMVIIKIAEGEEVSINKLMIQ